MMDTTLLSSLQTQHSLYIHLSSDIVHIVLLHDILNSLLLSHVTLPFSHVHSQVYSQLFPKDSLRILYVLIDYPHPPPLIGEYD